MSESIDQATGATISHGGHQIDFPDDHVYPSDSPKQHAIDDQVAPFIDPLQPDGGTDGGDGGSAGGGGSDGGDSDDGDTDSDGGDS